MSPAGERKTLKESRPKAAPLPPENGVYWLKWASLRPHYAANQTTIEYYTWETSWQICGVEVDRDSDYHITAMLGGDDIAKWNDDYMDMGHVIVEVGSRILDPDGVPL